MNRCCVANLAYPFTFLLLLCILFTAQSAEIYWDTGSRFQTIEGFGGGFSFHKDPYNHPKKDDIFDSIFNRAGVNILRIPNWYDPAVDTPIREIPMLLEIQKKWPHVKVMLTTWSPPTYLKGNNSILGNNQGGTLKKNSDSTYMYDEYADYWLKSIRYFRKNGVRIDWVSIQNEPDWPTPDYEGCILEAAETDSQASYGKALNAVYTKCNVENNENISFVGPDVPGAAGDRISRYLESPELNRNHLTAYAHHYYDYSGPEWLLRTKNVYNDKPFFQTEFLVNENVPWGDILRTWHFHAQVIHHFLTAENAQMYCLFALTYKPLSTHCFFSLDTLGGEWYQVRPTYHMFKHFSKSIHRGWVRVAAASDNNALLVSMFRSPTRDSSAVIIINTDSIAVTANYLFPGMQGEMYQTTDSVQYAKSTLTSGGTVTLPVKSITTFDLRTNQSGIRMIQQLKKATTLLEYAHGTKRSVVIGYAAVHAPATFSLVDLQGTLLAKETVPASTASSAAFRFKRSLSPGTYIVTMRSAIATSTHRVIVED